MTGHKLSDETRKRMEIMVRTTDGFEIAEADLKLRGSGELLGTRQSGEQGFRLATPEQVEKLLATAHDDARLLTAQENPLETPRGQSARTLLYLFEQDAAVATLRGG